MTRTKLPENPRGLEEADGGPLADGGVDGCDPAWKGPRKGGVLSKMRAWAALVRDLAIILIVPGVLYTGLEVYDLQTKASDTQIKAVDVEVEALKTQSAGLIKALDLLATQKDRFDEERQKAETDRRELQELQEQTLQFNARLQQLQDDLQQFQPRIRRRPARGG
jgi:hypothetical protein